MKTWVQMLRRRALWLIVATSAIAVGIIVTTTLPVMAVLTPAALIVFTALNTMTSKMTEHTCFGCGVDISDQPISARGRICPGCGAVNERIAMSFMKDTTRRDEVGKKQG